VVAKTAEMFLLYTKTPHLWTDKQNETLNPVYPRHILSVKEQCASYKSIMITLDIHLSALLLGSSPFHAKRDFYEPEAAAFRDVFGAPKKILFLPFALKDHETYAKFYQNFMETLGYQLEPLNQYETNETKKKAVEQAEGLFIGGGNTFRLLASLHAFDLFDLLKKKIAIGTPYLGTSAGATLFCQTIMTTNDMPIVEVPNLDAFGFLPFQINPHFPNSETQGAAETRRDRLREFHEENALPILALRENGFIVIKKGRLTLGGEKRAVLFRRELPSLETNDLTDLKI